MKSGHFFFWLCVMVLPCVCALALSEERASAQDALQVQSGNKPNLVVQVGHSNYVLSVAYSPDGKTIASAGVDHTVKLWDAATGQLIRTLSGHSDWVLSVAFSPDGKTIASATRISDRTVKLWDAATGRLIRTLRGPSNSINSVNSVAFSPDGKTLVSASDSHDINVWDATTGQLIRTLTEHTRFPDEVESVAFSPDGTIIASASRNRVTLWDANTGQLIRTITGHTDDVNSVAFSPDGKSIASASKDTTVKIWNVDTGQLIRTLQGHTGNTVSVAFSPDGKTLASASWTLTDETVPTINVWDTATGQLVRALVGHTNGVSSVAFSPDGKTIASAGLDQTVKVWDAATGQLIRSVAGYSSDVRSAVFSPYGRSIATASGDELDRTRDHTVKLWDTETGQLTRTFSGYANSVNSVAFSPDGKTVATAIGDVMRGSSPSIKIWDAATGQSIRTLTGHTDAVWCVAFSPDGRTLASASWDKTIKLWDAATGQLIRTLSGHTDAVWCVAFSPDGKTVASVSGDNTVKLWDTTTGDLLNTFTGPRYRTSLSVAFSPDGKTLACSTIGMWDAGTGQSVRPLLGQISLIHSVAFSPDGKTLAGAGEDRTVKLWDAATGQLMRTLTGHTDAVTSVAFSPDGKTIVSASRDTAVKVWDKDTGRELCSLYAFGDSGDWVVVAPDGRFDTNDLDGNGQLHWVLPDDPFTPLPLELFERQYYEPRLLPRLLAHDPTLAKPADDISSLYRKRPTVVIDPTIRPDPSDPQRVIVNVAVTQVQGTPPSGFSEAARDSPTQVLKDNSVHDLRLFRDGQLVGYAPDAASGGVVAVDPATGAKTYAFSVRRPQDGRKQVTFSAYAFNCDLIKSDTAHLDYALPAAPAVLGKAYVISMGVNDYQDRAWNLRYCVNDAKQIQDDLTRSLTAPKRFRKIVPVPLLSDNTDQSATRAMFHAVCDILAGHSVDTKTRASIPNGEKLAKATPEDLVIVSFSCHGAADGSGNFYLFPRDIGPGPHDRLDDDLKGHAISSDDLSYWLRDVDAGQFAMIVDACHSAASVQGLDFKPGPMDSRGLGQLAYDKGMRILAASQADDVALESSQIGDGLLTFALTHDALGLGLADTPQEGQITLTKWLKYGVDRVPTLYTEAKTGRISTEGRSAPVRSVALVDEPASSKTAPSLQQPSLFDFFKGRNDPLIEQR